MANTRMVVFFLSYGTALVIEYLGPQFVQLMNGYRYRRSAGSNISRKQSGQTEMSGETG